jgi:hypothetical protein
VCSLAPQSPHCTTLQWQVTKLHARAAAVLTGLNLFLVQFHQARPCFHYLHARAAVQQTGSNLLSCSYVDLFRSLLQVFYANAGKDSSDFQSCLKIIIAQSCCIKSFLKRTDFEEFHSFSNSVPHYCSSGCTYAYGSVLLEVGCGHHVVAPSRPRRTAQQSAAAADATASRQQRLSTVTGRAIKCMATLSLGLAKLDSTGRDSIKLSA